MKNKTMKAMVLARNASIEADPLTLSHVSIPEPGGHEIRIQVIGCAICRTDLHVIEGELPPARLPLIPGHQIVGIVEKNGPGCHRLKLGQVVGIAWLGKTCQSCVYCSQNKENLCNSPSFTGYHRDGGYAEYAIADEDYAYPLPDGLDPIKAAPLLCAGIIGYRALQRARLPEGGKLGLVGFGSSAHIVIQLALARRAKVFVVSRNPGHQAFAKKMGAHWVGDNPLNIGDKLDSAICFAPSGKLVPPILQALDKGGTLALAGIYMTPIPELDYEKTLFEERNLCSVTANTREDGYALLKEAVSIPLHTQTTTYPLDAANQALRDLKADRINGSGVLVL